MENYSTTELLVRKYTGENSPEELAVIDRLIENDPTVAADWNRLVTLMEKPEAQRHFSEINSEAEFQKLRKQLRLRRRRPVYYLAASLFIGLAVTLYIFYHSHHPINLPPADPSRISLTLATGQAYSLPDTGTASFGQTTLRFAKNKLIIESKDTSAALNKLSIPNGKTYQLILEDGSKITLNAASSLEFPLCFNRKKRNVSINGEAYMTVAANPNYPFTVITRHGTIQVLGTDFNINTYTGLIVSLTKGALKVSTKESAVQLRQGQRVRVDTTSYMLKVAPFDPQDIGWLNGDEWLDNANIYEVAQAITRHFDVKVLIDSPIDSSMTYAIFLNSKRQRLPSLVKVLTAIRPYTFYLDTLGQVHIR